MKTPKIASIELDENENIFNTTYNYVSEQGIKIVMNGKNEITFLTIPNEIKNSIDLEKLLIQAINHANVIVREMIQNSLIKELLKKDPQLMKELKISKTEENGGSKS